MRRNVDDNVDDNDDDNNVNDNVNKNINNKISIEKIEKTSDNGYIINIQDMTSDDAINDDSTLEIELDVEMSGSYDLNEDNMSDFFDKLLDEVNSYILDNELENDKQGNDKEEHDKNISIFEIEEEIKQYNKFDQIDKMINQKYYELTELLEFNSNLLQKWNNTCFDLFLQLDQTDKCFTEVKEIVSASNEFMQTDAIQIRNDIHELSLEFDVIYENALEETNEKNDIENDIDIWTRYILNSRKDDILYKKEILTIEFERYLWYIDSFKEYLEKCKKYKWSYLWTKSNCFFN